jgi:uncharacterized protein
MSFQRYLVAFLILCIASLHHSGSLAQSRQQYDSVMDRIEFFYNQEMQDSVYLMLSPRAKTLIPQAQLTNGLKDLKTKAGTLTNYQLKKDAGAIMQYTAEFEKTKLMVYLTLKTDLTLESFRLAPLEEPKHDTLNDDGEEIAIAVGGCRLFGTLTLPAGKEPCQVVIIIPGSGPTDRNGNNSTGLRTNTYKMLADTLKKAGIACLRYDKRGVAASADALLSEDVLRFDTSINDAAACIRFVQQIKRFSEIIVVGHSEGSLQGMIAARQTGASKFVSIAGAGSSAYEILKTQLSNLPTSMRQRTYQILDSVKDGHFITNLAPEYQTLFRPSVQPYLYTWFLYEPQIEIKKLTIPILVVQGGKDVQVATNEAELLHNAAPSSKLVVFPTMDHVLKATSISKPTNNYADPSIPLLPGLPACLVTFIKQ